MVKEEIIVATKWSIVVEAKNLQVFINDIVIGNIQKCLHSFLVSMQNKQFKNNL
jgi:hypothetical protein